MIRFALFAVLTLLGVAYCVVGRAAIVTFFDPDQVATLVAEGTTSDQIRKAPGTKRRPIELFAVDTCAISCENFKSSSERRSEHVSSGAKPR